MLQNKLKSYIESIGMTRNELSTISGVSKTIIYRLADDPQGNFTKATLENLVQGFKKAGHEPDVSDLLELKA